MKAAKGGCWILPSLILFIYYVGFYSFVFFSVELVSSWVPLTFCLCKAIIDWHCLDAQSSLNFRSGCMMRLCAPNVTWNLPTLENVFSVCRKFTFDLLPNLCVYFFPNLTILPLKCSFVSMYMHVQCVCVHTCVCFCGEFKAWWLISSMIPLYLIFLRQSFSMKPAHLLGELVSQ